MNVSVPLTPGRLRTRLTRLIRSWSLSQTTSAKMSNDPAVITQ